MRRLIPAATLAALMVAFASPANAGYLIIRVILEGNGGAGEAGTEGAGGMTPTGPRGSGSTVSPMGMGGGIQPPMGMGNTGMGTGNANTPPAPTGATKDPTRSIVVVVPVDEDLNRQAPFYLAQPGQGLSNPLWNPKFAFTLRGEKISTNLFTDSSTIQWYNTLKETPAFKRTHDMDVRDRFAAWAKTKSDAKAGYDIVVSALSVGMVDDALDYSDQLLTAIKDKKLSLAPEVSSFVKAYGAMQKGIRGAAPNRSNADVWQAKLEAPNLTPSAHYALLSWDATEDEVRRRVAILEENFKGFFLWHATRGVELPLPQAPLTAVLARQGREVLTYARALDVPSRFPSDGFYSPTHDVLVLSPERLDSVGLTFNVQTQQMYLTGASRKELLAGRGPKIDLNGQNGLKKPEEVARMQTTALVDRMVEETAAACAISREGTQQLLYATDQMPRHVTLPAWLSNGSVNFFTHPKDPAFVLGPDKNWWMTVSPTSGYGVPNYVLQRQFRDLYGPLLEDKKIKKDQQEQSAQRAALLRSLLADAYFLGLRDPKTVSDPDPVKADSTGVALKGAGTQPATGAGGGTGPMGMIPGGMRPMGPEGTGMGQPAGTVPPEEDPIVVLRKKRELLTTKAHATSWALYYYLAKDKPNELRKFVSELAVLPRDLPLDGATVTAAFCRSFGISEADASFTNFANGWMDYIHTVAPAGIDVPLVDPKPPTGTGTGTGTGMQPGTGSLPKGR